MIRFFHLSCIPYYSHIIKFTIIPFLKIQPFLLCIKYKKRKSRSSISNQTNGKTDNATPMTLTKDKISIATKHIKRHPMRYHFIGMNVIRIIDYTLLKICSPPANRGAYLFH